MHRAGYEALGLDFSYVPFKVTELSGALAGMRALGIRGFGVSMPYKLEVMPLLDRIDALAERIGAVNTIVNDGGVLTGYNTDAWGAVRALEEALPLSGQRVCLIGAGGAARAVAYALHDKGLRVHIVNRTQAKAEQLAREVCANSDLEATAGGLDALGDLRGFSAVINGSSAGMAEYGSQSLIREDTLRRDLIIMDLVYKPLRTELVRAAERVGAPVIHGGRMLLFQACAQFELYTGRPAPIAAMAAALAVAATV